LVKPFSKAGAEMRKIVGKISSEPRGLKRDEVKIVLIVK
jgi:hypothetical protein